MVTFQKDPADTLDYTVDWTDFLDVDNIDSVLWTVPAPLESVQQAQSAKLAVVWIRGGSNGGNYKVTCCITTASSPTPRIAKRSFKIKISTL